MRPKREHATHNQQTYMVTSETWCRRALFPAEPWATLLIGTLYHCRESGYLLHAFVVMPDHFHVLITPKASAHPGFVLDEVPQRLKPRLREAAPLQSCASAAKAALLFAPNGGPKDPPLQTKS